MLDITPLELDAQLGRGWLNAETHPRRRFLIVHNPTAGARKTGRLAALIDILRQRHGAEVSVYATTGRADATRRLRALRAEDGDAVVVAGGDGTINEAINGLMTEDGEPGAWIETGRAFGVIPLGTANVLAAELGIDADPRRLAASLIRGPARPVHLGLANGRAFSMMVGVGLDARVVAHVDPSLKRLAGKGAYVAETLNQVMMDRGVRYAVEIDGVVHDVAGAIIANGHFYGGTFVCAPDASLFDPSLHVCLFPQAGRLQALRYLWGVTAGRLRHFPDYQVIPAKHVVVRAPENEVVQGDGDIVAQLPVDIRVATWTVPMILPAE